MNLTHEDAIAACIPKEPSYVPLKEEVLTDTVTAADLVKLEGEGVGEGETDLTLKEEREERREVMEVIMGVSDDSAVEMKKLDDAGKEAVETVTTEGNSETVTMDTDVQKQVTDAADAPSVLSPSPVPAIIPLSVATTFTTEPAAAAAAAATVTAVAAVVVTATPTDELPIRSKPSIPSVLLCPMVLTLTSRSFTLIFS